MQELDENGEPLVPDGEGNNPEPETFTADEVQLQERIEAMIPATIDDILTFANSYDAPEQVEAVFKWDVADIFYNYFFVGNYIDVGGPTGDLSLIHI